MQPVLYVDHGSPMNAIEVNSLTQSLAYLGGKISMPDSILIISAHWLTGGTYVTYTDGMLETIHDFGGFPAELYDIQYPANGSKKLAYEIAELLKPTEVNFDSKHGLDHGAWSVLTHLFPKADIPIVGLGIDVTQPPHYHFDLGQKLSKLSKQNVLIIASGNIIHSFEHLDFLKNSKPRAWALEFQADFLDKLKSNNWIDLLNFQNLKHYKEAINTADHYFPLFYALGAAQKESRIEILNDGIQLGSMSMLSIKFGE